MKAVRRPRYVRYNFLKADRSRNSQKTKFVYSTLEFRLQPVDLGAFEGFGFTRMESGG